jgi:amino acid transporter
LTLTYGVLFWATDGSIDELFWSIFAFSSIVFLLPYVMMALSFAKLRVVDADAHRPYRVPLGRFGAWTATSLCLVALVLAVVFFLVDPFDLAGFDGKSFGLIMAGLAVTFAVQEIFVARSPRWQQRVRDARGADAPEHPELVGEVALDGIAPDDASALTATHTPEPSDPTIDDAHHLRS